jgi:hypothetical protein
MVDLVIVSLVHQTPEMVEWMADNLKRYVTGSFVWVVHYNGQRPLDLSRLPDWVWPVPDPEWTQTYTTRIASVLAKCIRYAASRTTFTNVLTMSSGTAFFRPYTVPTIERVQFPTYERLLDANCPRLHLEPIPIAHLGACVPYINARGYPGAWQFGGFDKHTAMHAKIRTRGFQWIRGSQWSGQLIPRSPALQFAEDMVEGPDYVAEEVLLSTYSYNYAVTKGLPIWASEAIIDWVREYFVSRVETIQDYRRVAQVFPGLGHMVCKVPDDPLHPVRVFLNTSSET